MCSFIYGPRLFGVIPQDRHTSSDIFTDFHRWRSCLTACEFGTFTLGGDLPQLAQPTSDFYYDLFLCFQLWTVGLGLGRCPISEPITPIHQEWLIHHHNSPAPDSMRCYMPMNAIMPIHIFNSHGSYAIIFHIIQTIKLTHQFRMHQQSYSPHIKHAIHIKQ